MSTLDQTIEYLEGLGAAGDKVIQQATSEAAKELRNNDLVRDMAAGTGVDAGALRKRIRLYNATTRNEATARLVFSGSGIPVSEYSYRARAASHATRSQILVQWFGSEKLAAGFINQKSTRQLPLATMSRKTVGAKTYTDGKGKLTDARGPSAAAMWQDMDQTSYEEKAQVRLSAHVAELLEALEP